MPKDGNVTMNLFDINGRIVQSVINNEYRTQGSHQINTNTDGLMPGMYFLNYQSGRTMRTLKLLKI